MAESTGAKQEEKPTKSRVKPTRERVAQKQLVSARRGATTNELAEEQAKGGGTIGLQRAAVRPISGDVVASALVSTESRFAHDFSRVPTHTVAPQAGSVVQTKLTVNTPGDQYEQEADHVAETVMGMIAMAGQQSVQHQKKEPAMTKTLVQQAGERVQQQALAAQIGRVQGNRHLGRVVAAVKPDEKMANSTPALQMKPA